ncbi:hypothetical protein KPH14_012045 [Odynerus spinipes]|uniref:peptidylprolyl isomerase n=1 Tax=Odynerus spinipes TaxID=1348599 RepID=A0AAD9RUS5_9HYME|nr:hypothetical protein KPH14_012045 [Odynerus spinipes]
MAKCINPLDGFTLSDLMSPDGFTIEIGDEYLPEEEEEFSYNSDVFLSNEEVLNMLNMDEFKDNEDEEVNEATAVMPCGISFATMKTKMSNLIEDGRVMKLIKRKGVGEIIPYNAQITINYIGYFEFSDEPFDSTYAHGHPKTVRLDQGLLLPGLEIAITSMKKHEIALFIVHPDLAYGPVGCPPRILPNEEVMFAIHLIDFIDNGTADTYVNLSVEEKKLFKNIIKCVNDLLNTAKDNFKKQKTRQAIRQYKKAVVLLENAELNNDEEEEEANKLLSTAYGNLAVCYNKEGMSRHACMACNKAPTRNVKIHFNHGRALLRMGEYSRALQELRTAHRMEPKNKDIFKEICLANEKYNRYREIEKRLWSNCLNAIKEEKEATEFQKAARDMCESFAKDDHLSRQPFPEGVTAEEEKYIREQAAALGLSNKKLKCYIRFEYINNSASSVQANVTMLLLFAYLLTLLNLSNSATSDVQYHLTPDKSQGFFLGEVLLDAFVNPMGTIQDDRMVINNIFDPNLLSKDVTFELYTKNNPIQAFYLKVGDVVGLKDSPFNSERPTKLLIHGWTDSANTYWLQDFRQNYLGVGDYNVICVNWFPASLKEYWIAAKLTRQVGKYIAELLDFLVLEGDLSLDNVHILGHSLGAHVAGFAGVEVSGTIGRITGMDPARPGFESPSLNDLNIRLDSRDAKFVDIIHTCAGTLGFVRSIGHVDFYPNGGTFRQPGCPVFSSQYCSHARAHEFVGESIINPMAFGAVQCKSWVEYKMGKCRDNSTMVFMGESVSLNARGSFFLETNAQPPFGKSGM